MTTHTLPPEVKLDERALEAAMKAFIANPVARPENRGFPLRMAIMAYLSALEPSGEGVGAEAAPSDRAQREALLWYAEQVEGCRKLGSVGDPFRHALDKDGGRRAKDALSVLNPTPAPTLFAKPLSGMEGAAREADQIVAWLRGKAVEAHRTDIYATTASRSTIFNHVADLISREFLSTPVSAASPEGEVTRAECTSFIADPCGSSKCAGCGRRRAEHRYPSPSTQEKNHG